MRDVSRSHTPGRVVAALDVGSSKITCLIVDLATPNTSAFALENARVLGVGVERSRGIKAGVVFDQAGVELSIRGAVDKAERQAGLSIDQLCISMNAGRLRSQNYGAVLELAGAKVKQVHIDSLLREGWDRVADSPDAILHSLPLGFALDGATGIGNPLGYSGQRLFADFHVVSADLSHVRRLLSCVEDSYLSPVSVVAAPYASALATARPREVAEGVAVLDLGGGTSSLAVFVNGQFVYANSIAKGGNAITSTLARSFDMSWLDAERLKLHIGANGDRQNSYPKGRELISGQLMGIFLHQKKKMLEAGFAFDAVKYFVLTGGTSRYHDAPRMAAQVFGKPARVGVPGALSGMPQQLVNPAFAALWGVIAFQNTRQGELAARFAGLSGGSKGSFGRFGNWLQGLGG